MSGIKKKKKAAANQHSLKFSFNFSVSFVLNIYIYLSQSFQGDECLITTSFSNFQQHLMFRIKYVHTE